MEVCHVSLAELWHTDQRFLRTLHSPAALPMSDGVLQVNTSSMPTMTISLLDGSCLMVGRTTCSTTLNVRSRQRLRTTQSSSNNACDGLAVTGVAMLPACLANVMCGGKLEEVYQV